jgi:putative NADH-flavin reductase
MTSIAIIGGTGYAGSHIAREAAGRGLDVTTVSRSAPSAPITGATHVVGSLADQVLVEKLAGDHDVLAIAVHATGQPALLDVLDDVIAAAEASGTRLAFVGGAGSTLVADGGPRLVDTDAFPAEYKPEALAHGAVLDRIRAHEGSLEWFYVSPAALFGAWNEGEATGSYRTSDDVLLADAEGNSAIGGADYAKAFVDEIVTPAHRNARFHVAY